MAEENTNPTTPTASATPSTSRARFRAPAQGQASASRRTGGANFNRRSGGSGGNNYSGNKRPRTDKKPKDEDNDNLDSQVIEVKRVTRVVKGGKRMRFAALVVVGNRQGLVGFGFKKGLDYQESVAKATKRAKDNLIKVELNEAGSVAYPLTCKHKSAVIFLKPATSGTGLISGGYLRPVLELAGVQNVYTKILGSRNKIAGVQAAMKALQMYQTK